MSLTVKSTIKFEVKDGSQVIFQSGQRVDQSSVLTEFFGGKFNLTPGQVDFHVPMYGVTNAQRLFIFADQDIRIKVVMNGYNSDNTPAFYLPVGAPFIVATKDIIGIFVSNPSAATAVVTVAGAGDDTGALPPLPGSGGLGQFHQEFHTITALEAAAKSFNLPSTPADPTRVIVDILNGGGPIKKDRDFTLVGPTFSWVGTPLDGLIGEGDELRFQYFT